MLDQLQKRGRHRTNRCPLCGEEENIDHLLLLCEKVQDLWVFLFALFGVSWNLPCSTRETLIGWRGSFVRKRLKKIFKSAYLSLMDNLEGKEEVFLKMWELLLKY